MSRNHFGIAVPGIAAVSFAALLLSGCSAADTEVAAGTPAPTEPTAAAPAQTPSPTLPTGPVTAPPPASGTLLAQLDDQTGAGHIADIPTDSESLLLVLECEGSGTLEAGISGVVTFTQQCSTGARNGSMNSVDVRRIEGNVDIEITADEDLRWAFSVSGADLITPAPQPAPTSG